jgi:hypothetical protein
MFPIILNLTPRPGVVTWLDFGSRPFVEPFFAQTVAGILAKNRKVALAETTADYLVDITKGTPSFYPSGIIFHISRCGSTLLSNGLRIPRNVIAISEAQPFTSVLATDRFGTYRAHLLAGLARIFGHHSDGRPAKLVVKFSSPDILSLRFVRTLWPGVPCVIAIRNPLEVIVSNLSRPSTWLLNRSSPRFLRRLFGREGPRAMQWSIEEYSARVLGRYCQSALSALDEGCIVVDYTRLNAQEIHHVANLFGISLPADADGRLDELLTTHSHRKTPFDKELHAEQHRATEGLRRAARKWADPYYEELRRVR